MNLTIKHLLLTITVLILPLKVASQKQDITIDQLYSGTDYYPYVNEYNSMNDGIHYTCINDSKQILSIDYATGESYSVLMDIDEIENCPINEIHGYIMSPDETMILVYDNMEMIYRYSYKADFYLYNIKYKTIEKLSEKGNEQTPQFSPNSSMIAYVQNNNIFIKKLKYNSISPVTTDGRKNEIINGLADWVYEEEFLCTTSFKWSPDSKEIAYIRFDETEVSENTIQLYKASNPSIEANAIHPSEFKYKYPKTSEKNSNVSVCVYNLDTRKTKTMDTGNNNDIYLPRIEWTGNDKELAIIKINRRQNQLDILLGNSATTICKTIMTDKNKRYISEDVLDNFKIIQNGQSFIYTSEQDGYNHIYLYGINGVEKGNLTEGNWDVTQIYDYDETTKNLYYQAAKTTPLEHDIYCVNIDTKKTTALTHGGGTYNISFSKNFKYSVRTFSNITTPTTETICDSKWNVKRVAEDNSELKKLIGTSNFHNKEFFTFNNSNGDILHGWMIKPNNFDSSKKYPLLIVQYSGPNSQEVLNQWSIDWEQALASAGYIITCIDTRGTGGRGEEFRKCTYLKLGKYESDDIIEAAKYLGSLNYIDSKRIGLWGWSYGGYMTSLCMCKSDLFKIGIAIAPVTNWRFYDTIYTERYMRTPEDNPSGFDELNPIKLAKNLNGRIFLIHGTADDNVHLQNQFEFVDELAINGKQFDMFTYPNRNHSIYGGPIRTHLYTMMLDYIKLKL